MFRHPVIFERPRALGVPAKLLHCWRVEALFLVVGEIRDMMAIHLVLRVLLDKIEPILGVPDPRSIRLELARELAYLVDELLVGISGLEVVLPCLHIVAVLESGYE